MSSETVQRTSFCALRPCKLKGAGTLTQAGKAEFAEKNRSFQIREPIGLSKSDTNSALAERPSGRSRIQSIAIYQRLERNGWSCKIKCGFRLRERQGALLEEGRRQTNHKSVRDRVSGGPGGILDRLISARRRQFQIEEPEMPPDHPQAGK